MLETGLPKTMEEALVLVRESPTQSEGFALIADATDVRYLDQTYVRSLELSTNLRENSQCLLIVGAFSGHFEISRRSVDSSSCDLY